MTSPVIVGQAAVQIRATGTQFASDITRTATPALSQLSRQTEGVAYRGTRAFGNMWQAFSQNTQGAMAPVMGLVSNVQMAANTLEKGASRYAKVGVAAAGGLGIGMGLQAFASQEQAAEQQFAATLSNMGKNIEDYHSEIDGAVSSGEHFGQTAATTIDALNRLTMSTHDPTQAVKDYTLVLDMAKTRHIAVGDAVQSLVSAYAGNTRMFKQYGIDVTSQTQAIATQTSAQKAHAAAVASLTDKQRALRQEQQRVAASVASSGTSAASHAASLASAQAAVTSAQASVDAAKFHYGTASPQAAAATDRLTAAEARLTAVRQESTGPTGASVSQNIALSNAHRAVADAQAKVRTTTKDLTTAQHDAKGAAGDMNDAIGQLQDKLKGQASAATDTWAGRLEALKAHLEDDAATIGAKYGPALTAVSTGVLAASTLAEGGMAIFSRFSSGARAATAANAVFMEATATQVAASAASTEADLAILESQSLQAQVEMSLAAEDAGTTTSAAWAGAAAESEASLSGLAAAGSADMAGIGAAAEAAAATGTAAFTGMAATSEAELAGVGAAAEAAAVSTTAALGLMNTALLAAAAGLTSYQLTKFGLNKLPQGAKDDIQQWIGHDLLHARGDVTHPSAVLGSGTAKVAFMLGLTEEQFAALPRPEQDQLVNAYDAAHPSRKPKHHSRHHRQHHQHHGGHTAAGDNRTQLGRMLLGDHTGHQVGGSLGNVLTGSNGGHRTQEDRHTHLYLLRVAAGIEKLVHISEALPNDTAAALSRSSDRRFGTPETRSLN